MTIMTAREHQPINWFARGIYMHCSCGYDPKDNGKMYDHWAEHGISWYHDTRIGQLICRAVKKEDAS